MAHDVRHNGGMPATVDTRPFTVGGNLAVTPGQVVHRSEVFELIQYTPAGKTTFARPLVAIPPQINKYYISDLAPGRSLIEHLVGAGVPYFAVSWRNPTAAQRDWNLDTYVAACKEAIEVACEITGSPDANVVGMCAGAITMACLLGHLAATGEALVNSATFLVAGLDTAQESQIGMLASKPAVEAARLRSQRAGYLDGKDLAKVFAWLRPNDLVWNYWVNNYLLGPEPTGVRHPLLERRHHPPAGGAARRLPGPGHLERARRGHPHGARHARRSRQGRARRLRGGRLDRSHRALADRLPDHPAARRRVGVRAQLERPHPGHRQPARQPEGVLSSPARARRRRTPKHGSTVPRRTRAAGGSTGRHGSPPVPVSGGRHRASWAAPPIRRSTPPRAATSTSHDGAASSTFVRVDGHLVRVSTRGEGRPLLLIMGLGGNIEMWDPLERALTRRGVQTIAYDASGTGESPPRLVPQRMHGLARQAAHVLDALGHPDADVLGVSFGGAVAQELALANPHRVRRLVLASTMCGLGGVPGNPVALSLLATPLRYYSPTFLRLTANVLYGPGAGDDEGLLRNQIDARRARPPSMWGYIAQLAAGIGWTSLPWLHRIQQPTLVLSGARDPIVPPINARILARRIPNAELEIVPNAGHLLLMEHAASVSERIATFLGLPAQAAPQAGSRGPKPRSALFLTFVS